MDSPYDAENSVWVSQAAAWCNTGWRMGWSGSVCLALGLTTGGFGGVACVAALVGTGAWMGTTLGDVGGEIIGGNLYEKTLR